jgi:hypothetical protein
MSKSESTVVALLGAPSGVGAALTTAALAPDAARTFLAAAAGIAPGAAPAEDFARVFAAVGTLPLPLFIVGACARAWLEPLHRSDAEAERGVLGRVAAALAEAGSNIQNVHVDDDGSEIAVIHFKVQARDRQHLAHVIRTLRRVKEVSKVLRVRLRERGSEDS